MVHVMKGFQLPFLEGPYQGSQRGLGFRVAFCPVGDPQSSKYSTWKQWIVELVGIYLILPTNLEPPPPARAA